MNVDLTLDQSDALIAPIIWIRDVLLGSVVATTTVLAVAMIGLLMLRGRMPLRRGAIVVLGSFILFSAASIAEGLLGTFDRSQSKSALMPSEPAYTPTTPKVVPDDPYAGAAVPVR